MTICEKVYVFSSIFDSHSLTIFQKDLMKNMQFCQLSKIDLPIVKDLGILVLVLVTRSRSLHVLPLANSGLGQSSIQVFHREPQTLKKTYL